MYISRKLRKKLDLGQNDLKTVMGQGYACVTDVDNAPPVLHLLNGGDAAAVTMCISKLFNT